MYSKRILCLANSRKPPSGRCVAGKVIAPNNQTTDWIRPVSARPGHEISEEERRYEDGTTAQVLDVIDIPFLNGLPVGHQTENHLIADDYYWKKTAVATWKQVKGAEDCVPGPLWLNGHSTNHGRNDKVPDAALGSVHDSLKLIVPSQLTLTVAVEPGFAGQPGRRRVRAAFDLNGHPYILSLTDPVVEAEFLGKADGKYDLGPAAVCVSLAESWNGYAYKVAATVITKKRCDGG